MTLPNDKDKRKEIPIFRGALMYFPDAIAEVAHVSYVGNQQHNPGEELHWARGKSMDQEDCLVRHLMERGTLDSDGIRHSAKVAWRALAMLQLEIEADRVKEANAKLTQEIPTAVRELAKQSQARYEKLIEHRVAQGAYDIVEIDYPSKERTR